MANLADYVRTACASDPIAAARFANSTYRLIKIKKKYYRGYRKMQDAEVALNGEKVSEKSATLPSWKLVPEEMKEEFSTLDRAVDLVLSTYCTTNCEDEDDTDVPAVMTGYGVYSVLSEYWPRVEQLLKAAQARWIEAAARWCTEEGYTHFHELLEKQLGTVDYSKAKDLLPEREKLLSKFGLIVFELPVKISEDNMTLSTSNESRIACVAELITNAIKQPRLDMAEALNNLASQLVTTTSEGIIALQAIRTNKEGNKVACARRLKTTCILPVRKAVDNTHRCGHNVESALEAARDVLLKELPDDEGLAKELVKKLNSDDTEAVRLGKIALEAAKIAMDESSMCNAASLAFIK